jgi:transcriptional antiterminator NusG
MKRWYIVTTYSGYENSVKTDLERRRISMNMENMIYQVLIPEETVEVVDKKGKKKEKVNKLFPGYVFVEMEIDEVKGMDDDVWFMVRNTPKVTGFLGSSGGGTKPVPVANDEMNQILSKLGLVVKPKLDFAVGDRIEVVSGSFAGKVSEITDINEEKGIVTVLLEMFGSYIPTELAIDQVKKL